MALTLPAHGTLVFQSQRQLATRTFGMKQFHEWKLAGRYGRRASPIVLIFIAMLRNDNVVGLGTGWVTNALKASSYFQYWNHVDRWVAD